MPMLDLVRALHSIRPRRMPFPTGVYMNAFAWTIMRAQWNKKFPKEAK